MNVLEHYKHEEIISIVRNLVLIRVVEEEIVAKYGKPGEKQHMRCPVHLSIGQEAAAVGAVDAASTARRPAVRARPKPVLAQSFDDGVASDASIHRTDPALPRVFKGQTLRTQNF